MLRLLKLAFCSMILSANPAVADALSESIDSPHREISSVRDQYRHPAETLKFFDVQPHMSVVEIWPGAKGWYTEILAPYLRDEGKLYAAHFDADSPVAYFQSSLKQFQSTLKASPDLYDQVILTTFSPPDSMEIAPAGSVDRVLTFRNVHNWYMRGGGDEKILEAFRAFHKALKSGGVLGVVEHRLPKDRPAADQEKSGYMHEDYVIRMAEKAGFRLLEKSEINANPADDTMHPEGVWTLPPSLRLGEQDREKYLAIGESDRMTLKFIKEAE